MPIAYFGGHQTDVYLPALAALLVATAFVVVPVIAAPRVLHSRARGPIIALTVLIAAAGVAAAGVLAVSGTARLSEQRASVRVDIRQRYGLELPEATVAALVDGDKVHLPNGPAKPVRLESVGMPGEYVLTTGGVDGVLRRAA